MNPLGGVALGVGTNAWGARGRPRPELVPRPHLIERLNTGLRAACKLTLISAPAGFGKTTLLSAWIRDCALRPRVAWLSLDESDNDPARFLAYVIAALQTIEGSIGQGVLEALGSPGPLRWKNSILR
jgi:LuxR family maltose regulon positive regulatory protein